MKQIKRVRPRWVPQTINFMEKQHEQLRRESSITGASIAYIVREAVKEWLKRKVV